LSYRYLTRVPGVRSGNMIIANTRIGVHDVIGLVVNGATVDDVVRSFPERSAGRARRSARAAFRIRDWRARRDASPSAFDVARI
jgi:hypothetical protein